MAIKFSTTLKIWAGPFHMFCQSHFSHPGEGGIFANTQSHRMKSERPQSKYIDAEKNNRWRFDASSSASSSSSYSTPCSNLSFEYSISSLFFCLLPLFSPAHTFYAICQPMHMLPMLIRSATPCIRLWFGASRFSLLSPVSVYIDRLCVCLRVCLCVCVGIRFIINQTNVRKTFCVKHVKYQTNSK